MWVWVWVSECVCLRVSLCVCGVGIFIPHAHSGQPAAYDYAREYYSMCVCLAKAAASVWLQHRTYISIAHTHPLFMHRRRKTSDVLLAPCESVLGWSERIGEEGLEVELVSMYADGNALPQSLGLSASAGIVGRIDSRALLFSLSGCCSWHCMLFPYVAVQDSDFLSMAMHRWQIEPRVLSVLHSGGCVWH